MTSRTPPRGSSLEVRRPGRGWYVAAAALAMGTLGWWATHPAPLPTGNAVSGTTSVGRPLYFGVLGPSTTERTLHISDVDISLVSAPGEVGLAVWVCRGGSIGVTSNPAPFCPELEPASGAVLELGEGKDQLLLSVGSDVAGVILVEELQVTYREGLQYGTQPAGPQVSVEVLGR